MQVKSDGLRGEGGGGQPREFQEKKSCISLIKIPQYYLFLRDPLKILMQLVCQAVTCEKG